MSRPSPPPFDLILITEPELADPVSFVRRALRDVEQSARVAVQLRAKGWSRTQQAETAHTLADIVHACGSHLLINGDPTLCIDVAADGVQLPENGPSLTETRTQLGADAWIGLSCHDQARLDHAHMHGADFALLSPWGAVPGKGPALGRDRFGLLCRACHVPVYALGGIGLANIDDAIAAGAHGVAVIREAHLAHDPTTWVRDALSTIGRARRRVTID